MAERLAGIMTEYRVLEEEVEGWRREKAEVVRELGVQELAEYMTMYKRVQGEVSEGVREMARMEARIRQLERDK